MKGIFFTGTDTNIGKTIVSALLCSAMNELNMNPGYFKPIQTGNDDDSDSVKRLSGLNSESIERPVYKFNAPISPDRAAKLQNQKINISLIIDHWKKMKDRNYIVEGAGGVLVPINENQSIRDLIEALEIPVVIVASTRLGTINHTLLTIEALVHAKIPVLGTVLVGERLP